MSDTPAHIPTLLHSPTPSPRRVQAGPSSPRLPRPSVTSRLPSISAVQPLDVTMPDSPLSSSSRTSVVLGFSPTPVHQTLPAVMEASAAGSPRPPQLQLGATHHRRLSSLSPQLTTPVEQTFQFGPAYAQEGSPRPLASSPRAALAYELPPRSRRNSAAIVSISLSSRSRSRTPRGSAAPLPGQQSGQGTPNKGSTTVTPRGEETHGANKEVMVDMSGSWDPAADDVDDWTPAGGMLLDGEEDESAVIDDSMDQDDSDDAGRVWTGLSDASRAVEDVLTPGTIIGEGFEFQGEIIVPAVHKMTSDGGDDVGLPLRRGGSEVSKAVRGDETRAKKRYEVIRRLGTGSYAVVYLVKERGGRKREYALKCLSKQNLEEEQLETQLFEATIHLSLPIHQNVVTLYQTWQTRKWLFLMLELCPGEDLFYWLEKSRDASPQSAPTPLPGEHHVMSSSKLSSSSIPFSSSQMFTNLSQMSSSFTNSPSNAFSPQSHYSGSPASLLFAHHNGHHHSQHFAPSHTPPTPSLLSAFSANTLLSQRRLRLIASMFAQMCESVAVCHAAGVSHRDIKPENFICCDSVELEAALEGEYGEDGEDGAPVDFGPQAKRKVVVKLTDFGLATTEEESGDVECGSKPYMSYECRNNLGPTYLPAPADVWSLGIVLINMLFHRNPWKDPTPGDYNFDNFLLDPVGFLLTKFTGIGREVASHLANHVLCVDVDSRITAQEFGKWIKALPEMIGGRKALHALRLSRLDAVKQPSSDNAMFAKSPVDTIQAHGRKPVASGLTSSAPTPALSSLPPPSSLAQTETHESDSADQTLPTPDLEYDEMISATTVDEQPTPVDTSGLPSPDEADSRIDDGDESTTRSLSTKARRKRGLRRGKGAQAAAAASASGHVSPEERDALLAELASASQSLAREMSKMHKPDGFDATRIEEFPPLGTTPAQAAAAKKSKWRDMMKLSQGNPELAALARRVAERDTDESFKMSAPAKLQQGSKGQLLAYKPPFRQTTTASSGFSNALSSFGAVSSTTNSSVGVAELDDDWRKPRIRAEESKNNNRREEDKSRARKAAIAAAAITGNMESMGAFGKPSHLGQTTQQIRHQQPQQQHLTNNYVIRPSASALPSSAVPIDQSRPVVTYKSGLGQAPITLGESIGSKKALSNTGDGGIGSDKDKDKTTVSIQSRNTLSSVASGKPNAVPLAQSPSTSTIGSKSTVGPASPSNSTTVAPGVAPNKPKLKGQIHTLAKMLSGLKTKGKD